MIRIEPRREVRRWHGPVTTLAALAAAAAISGVVLLFAGHDPIDVYRRLISTGFTAPGAFLNTLLSAAPLACAGLAAAVAFRMQVWNIGGEGQLYLGAIASSGVGLLVGAHVPTAVSIALMIASGIGAGALWAAVPGVLRTRTDTNEILTTLMLNYVASLLAYYLIFGSYSHWRDQTSPAGKLYPEGKILDPAAYWPTVPLGDLVLPFGFVVVVFAAVVLHAVLRSTTFGFKLRVIGSSYASGDYAGMNNKRMFVTVMLVSGGLAGLGGAGLVGDFAHQLDPKALPASAYGYTGIVAAALARYNPLATIVSAVLLGALGNAGFVLQGANFPLGLVGTMQGILLFCVLAAEFFERHRFRIRRPDGLRSGRARETASLARDVAV